MPFGNMRTIEAGRGKTGRRLELSLFASIESAIAEIARSPAATSTNSARASEALGLFISDTVACLDTETVAAQRNAVS